jgi:hypothetical protein
MKAKIIIITIFLFTALHFQSYSQGYHQLINDSIYWDIAYAESTYICPGFSDDTPRRFYFNGDTVILNGLVYYQMKYNQFIELDGEGPNCGPFAIDTISSLANWATIREDTLNQKVYRYNYWNDEEVLIFDFSLNQGDTFHSDDLGADITVDTVYQYITEDGVERKYLGFSGEYYEGFMLEGIGGPQGPFNEPIWPFLWEYGGYLYCSESNDGINILYGPCDDFITGIDTHSGRIGKFEVYPNPFTDFIRIDCNNEIRFISLINLSGLVIESRMIDSKTVFFETSRLKSGMYFIDAIDNSKQHYRSKLIKINSL